MIKISFGNDLITMHGHAGYADHGKDIVCASVSSIVYTTVNGLMNIDKSCINFLDDGNVLTIKIIKHSEIVDILIKSMYDLLLDLSKQYPKNIKIDKGE